MSEEIKENEDNLNAESSINEQMQVRLEKMHALRKKGLEPFADKYDKTNEAGEIIASFEKYAGSKVSIAGRVLTMREHGKTTFMHLQDSTAKIQTYFREDTLNMEKYQLLKLIDIGDVLGIKGEVFKTQKGEISVRVHEFQVLSKALRPLPEKWHGLKDVEIRYRQRYVDMIVNPEVRKTFVVRSKVCQTIRRLLEDRGFLEVETPMMHPIPGGAAARPFVTHHNALDMSLYMRIAPELYLKRLVVGGMERVFELGKVFRNEGISIRHNPEFTMVELYQAYADYQDIMRLTEEVVEGTVKAILGTTKVNYQGTEIDFKTPWQRITMPEAIKKYSKIDFAEIDTIEKARKAADSINVKYEKTDSIGMILNLVFEAVAEEHLLQPTFIIGHPTDISPLAKRNANNPDITDRFEAFVYAREIANGFSELNDPIDQKQRFMGQVEQRESGDDEAHMMDEDYIRALEYGLPPTGGLGIGIDRLVMFLTDSYSIRDVILFPHMRHIRN